MPVIGGNNPTVNVTLPVPTPAPMKPKAASRPQPAPQPVPQNPESGQQPTPQGMVPQAIPQPEPRAVILPWAPADKPKKKLPRKTLRMSKRKYARKPTPEEIGSWWSYLRQSPEQEHIRHSVAEVLETLGTYTPRELQLFRSTPHLNLSFNPNDPKPIQFNKLTLADIRAANRAAGGHWFNRGNNSFFGTKFHGGVIHGPKGVFFITSELSDPGQRIFDNPPRKFTVREFDPESSGVSTLNGGYNKHSDYESAKHEAMQQAHREPHQLSRKRYSAADDDLSMDFDSMGEDELPRAPLQRPAPKEDITGRTRKQILQQMLEAAKKGHYDPAGMTPRDYIQAMENKDKDEQPQGGSLAAFYDPDEDDPTDDPVKHTRFRYSRNIHAELGEAFQAAKDNPDHEHLRHNLADLLEEHGRHEEAGLLRSNNGIVTRRKAVYGDGTPLAIKGWQILPVPQHPKPGIEFHPTVARMKKEVIRDIRAGIVPESVENYSQLHNHVDANYYGGAFARGMLGIARDGSDTDEAIHFWNLAQNEVDQWLRSGGHRSQDARPRGM